MPVTFWIAFSAALLWNYIHMVMVGNGPVVGSVFRQGETEVLFPLLYSTET